ncbi:Uncharacterized protein ESCO_005757 [Escovopsis weberi]|uniref:Oxidoreductase n=1 Tax=Escovopsis weberi TaxID=150374 RepID=A0A0M8N3K9_ESCWE|nr:Uncharacterized protein ESCO_005757 [Escovopsis weberi]
MALETPIGVALLGAGIFIKEQHLPAVLNNGQLSLKAIYSRSLTSAQAAAALVPPDHTAAAPALYASDTPGATLDDLLAREDIRGVIVALPILAQPDVVRRALAAGKHVLVEKPMANDVAGARGLLEDAERERARTGATLSVAENFRFHDKFRWAAERARALGGPVEHFSVRVMFRIDAGTDKYYKTEWRKAPQHQGGFLLDAGVHFAAATRMLLGAGEGADENRPDQVQAFSALVEPLLPPVDSVAAIIRTRRGAAGVFQLSVSSASSAFEWDFAYRGGRVRVAGDTVTVRPRGAAEDEVREFARASGVAEEVAAWAEGMRAGRVDALQEASEGLGDVEFIEKILQSGERQGAALRYEYA